PANPNAASGVLRSVRESSRSARCAASTCPLWATPHVSAITASTVITSAASSTFGIARRLRRKTSLRNMSSIALRPSCGRVTGLLAVRHAGKLEKYIFQRRAAAYDLRRVQALGGQRAVDIGRAFRRGDHLQAAAIDGDV